MNRREFIRYASTVTVLLSNGKILRAAQMDPSVWGLRKVKLRFVVASDGHYGQPGTEYVKYFETLVNRINEEHAINPFAFCMINGDIIHDEKKHFPAAKMALDQLRLRYYVSQGNHDHATPEEWEQTWNMPVNIDFAIGENAFLIATTSNEAGTYLCPNLQWITTQLEHYHKKKNIFFFLHINPGKLTKHAVDCPALFELLSKHRNVRALFNGHDHDEEGIKMKNNLPFIFDGHFGGSWGTAYRGFRVVELMKDNTILTYVMDPFQKINTATI